MTVSTAPRRAQTIAVWPLRVVSTIALLMVAAQPVFAGMFLSGGYSMLAAHRGVGGGLMAMAMLQALAAAALWWPGRRGPVPLVLAVAVLGMTLTQLIAGYARTMGLHLPLGVAIVLTQVLLVRWAWRGARS